MFGGSNPIPYVLLICAGTQSTSHRHALAELCGGALQFAEFPGAITVSFRDCFLRGIWRSENRGTGKETAVYPKTNDASAAER